MFPKSGMTSSFLIKIKKWLGANILKTGLWLSFTLGLIFIFSPKISLQLPKILSNLYGIYQFSTHKPKEDFYV
jgi:hypothetical protein